MALSAATGTITLTTGAIGTTFLVSGLAFQPKAVILAWSGRATAGQAEADLIHGIGFFTSTSSRRAYTSVSDHGIGTAVVDHMWRNDACVATHTVGGTTVGGLADVDQVNSDGFRLVIDDVFPANLLVGWLALGGADITDTAIVDISTITSPGNQDINVGFALDTGLDDKLVVIIGSGDGAVNTANNPHAKLGVGFAAGNSINQSVCAFGSTDAAGTSQTFNYQKTGEVLAIVDAPDALSVRASVTAWLSTGFRLNYAETAGSALALSALILKGGRYEVGTLTTSTGTTNQTEATAYVPVALFLVSHNNTESTSDTVQAHNQGSIGAAVSSSSRWAAGWLDKDGANTMDIGTAFHTDEMYSNQSTANTIAVEGLMDLVSLDATPGFTWVMDDADPVGSLVSYIGFASIPIPVNPRPPLIVLDAMHRSFSW